MAKGHGADPLGHVKDAATLDLPGLGEVHLPNPFGHWSTQFTRFMAMELIAAVLIALIVIPLARHAAKNRVTRGPFLNIFESMLMFIRDEVARPAIGGHGADKFLPFLWTVFFFVLFNNLLGMFPGGASPTGNINVTAVLALMTFGTVVLAGSKEKGIGGFWIGLVPELDVPVWLKGPLWVLMFLIEIAGLFIRHMVLAVRLFANMLAGHIVLAVILGFIILTRESNFFYLVMPSSILGAVALSLLELLVAFLQAYIFTFLSALFIGEAIHSH